MVQLSQGQHLASTGTGTKPPVGLVHQEIGLQLKSLCPARINYGGKYLSEFPRRSRTHTAAGRRWYLGLQGSVWYKTQFPGSESTKRVSQVSYGCQGSWLGSTGSKELAGGAEVLCLSTPFLDPPEFQLCQGDPPPHPQPLSHLCAHWASPLCCLRALSLKPQVLTRSAQGSPEVQKVSPQGQSSVSGDAGCPSLPW